MNLSYWEKKSWFSNIDFCVVGSGIVGLNCAIHLKNKYPKAKVLVIEKGILPQGASTKNAGFACFGSVSEILDDLKALTEKELFNLVKQRVEGLELLIQTLGKEAISYQAHGGYELFLEKNTNLFEECVDNMERINQLLHPIFNSNVFSSKAQPFHFNGVLDTCVYNAFEAQIDTGMMMQSLLTKAMKLGVLILNAIQLETFAETENNVNLKVNNFEFSAGQLCIATNAFANRHLNVDLSPARNQVLITKPIKNLDIKGTFHLDRGYYYFRNIDNRILLGGGRHIDLDQETTSEFGLTEKIQSRLEQLLRETILPNRNVEIDNRWSGILGTGSVKAPIIQSLSNRVHVGVRLGGMGVAIGSSVGRRLANLV